MGEHGKGGDDGDEVIEFTVVGTAVRAPWITHPPRPAGHHRSLRAGPLGARAGRLRAVRLPLRLLPLPRVARDEERHLARSGEVDGRARRHRDGAPHRRRASSTRRRRSSRPSSSSARTSRSTVREVPCGYARLRPQRPRRRRELVRHRRPPHPGLQAARAGEGAAARSSAMMPLGAQEAARDRRGRATSRDEARGAGARGRGRGRNEADEDDERCNGAASRPIPRPGSAMPADLPQHARERLGQMRQRALLHQRSLGERVPAREGGGLRSARPRDGQLASTRSPRASPQSLGQYEPGERARAR